MHTGDSKIQGYSLVCNNRKKTSKAVVSVKLNGYQTVDKLEVNGPTPHGFKGQRLRMAQSGLKLLGDACFTATFG